MSKCKRCNRKLKNAELSEMGKVCRMKAGRSSDASAKTVRVEPLFRNRQPRRSYLVFTSPRMRVVVSEAASGRVAVCDCSRNVFCEHIALVASADRAKFPQDLSR